MSDHPEIPRIMFNDDGESMNFEQAVARFRELLEEMRRDIPEYGVIEHRLTVEMKICDCDQDIRGRSEICPLHGNGTLS